MATWDCIFGQETKYTWLLITVPIIERKHYLHQSDFGDTDTPYRPFLYKVDEYKIELQTMKDHLRIFLVSTMLNYSQ